MFIFILRKNPDSMSFVYIPFKAKKLLAICAGGMLLYLLNSANAVCTWASVASGLSALNEKNISSSELSAQSLLSTFVILASFLLLSLILPNSHCHYHLYKHFLVCLPLLVLQVMAFEWVVFFRYLLYSLDLYQKYSE